MTFVHEEKFEINQNTYRILKVQSRFETTLTLCRQVSVLDQTELLWIPVFVIEEGDIIWNSIAANQVDKDQNISLIPCFNFLRDYVSHIENIFPDILIFKSIKKANQFSSKICKKCLHLTSYGPVYPL